MSVAHPPHTQANHEHDGIWGDDGKRQTYECRICGVDLLP